MKFTNPFKKKIQDPTKPPLPKKDKIFIFVLVIVVGNLIWNFMSALYSLVADNNFGSFTIWIIMIADIIAIIGILWLMRSYRRVRRLGREQSEQSNKKDDN
jgi:type VI protein secretion system component VasK